MAKEEKAKKEKKVKEKKEKKESFLSGVRSEMKMVRWPSFKEVLKYTLATFVLCAIFIVFFILINLLASFIKGMF